MILRLSSFGMSSRPFCEHKTNKDQVTDSTYVYIISCGYISVYKWQYNNRLPFGRTRKGRDGSSQTACLICNDRESKSIALFFIIIIFFLLLVSHNVIIHYEWVYINTCGRVHQRMLSVALGCSCEYHVRIVELKKASLSIGSRHMARAYM